MGILETLELDLKPMVGKDKLVTFHLELPVGFMDGMELSHQLLVGTYKCSFFLMKLVETPVDQLVFLLLFGELDLQAGPCRDLLTEGLSHLFQVLQILKVLLPRDDDCLAPGHEA